MLKMMSVKIDEWKELWRLGKGPQKMEIKTLIFIHFLPHYFSFAIESYIYETDFTLGLSQKYNFWVLL